MPASALPQDQGIKITGSVYDKESNTPLSGVNITLDGTESGTTTNSAGYFSLKVKKFPAMLFFSYLGYEVNQCQLNAPVKDPLKIYLKPEVRQIGEVTITGERILNLFKEDTLNIVDFELSGDRIIVLANPYKYLNDQRLYLTSLSGDILSAKKISNAGAMVEIPESIDIKSKIYLFKDCFKNIHILTQKKDYQIFAEDMTIQLIYPESIDKFESVLLPVKATLGESLFFQKTTMTENNTYLMSKGQQNSRLIKTVTDPFGAYRYARPIDFPDGLTPAHEFIMKKSYERCVAAPIVQFSNTIAIFDFFDNNIEFFNFDGISVKSVPIRFHLKAYYELILLKKVDIDLDNFTQKILYDDKANRAWSVWHGKSNGRYSLKEVNLDTGAIARVIDIPDYPFIDRIRVYDNTVYFLYLEKKYPYYRSLYRMVI